MSSNYETLYGVGLLDDLHNYFPALLYDSSSFGSVRDVLGYVKQQTRNRFDLFSYGLREYQASHPPRSEPVNNSFRRVVRTSFASMPAPSPFPASTLLSSLQIPSNASVQIDESQNVLPSTIVQSLLRPVPSIQVNLDADNEEEEEDNEEEQQDQANAMIANALLSLLNLPAGTLTRSYTLNRPNMDQFLQPVVVRPTPEQIDANTTVGNLVSEPEHACAICQDTLTSEQEGRKLNACGHWFHKGCIDTWLGTNVHCPVCRHDIREPANTNA